MDYDSRITELELELAHARAMQAFTRGRVDAHDLSFKHLKTLMDELTANVNTLTGAVQLLAGNVNALVAALLRQHPNGH